MRYGTVCSGIEAPSVAWHPLGWEPVFFSEIEKFPGAVLAHHYPDVPNLGDMTNLGVFDGQSIDLLIGGTPCQSFSVAGLRKGLADPRGNLALVYLAIADQLRPRWLVWENVPGVLSSSKGRDFGALLGALGELGYGFAYRVLDAQFFGVPQRRRRVFVVGCLGGWPPAAAVLFEPESLRRNPAPRRAPRPGVAALTASGVGTCGADDNQGQAGHLIPGALCSNGKAAGSATQQDAEGGHLVAHTLRGDGFDASEDGTGRGVPLVPSLSNALTAVGGTGRMDGTAETLIPFDPTQVTDPDNRSNPQPGGPCHPLAAAGHPPAVADTITAAYQKNHGSSGGKDSMPRNAVLAFQETQTGCREYDSAGTLRANGPGHDPVGTRLRQGMSARRLTPVECKRLQGFPDNYTRIPWRGKAPEDCPDGPRYKALGNSMAVPVVRWIGERIQEVDGLETKCSRQR